jgi:hypothetical protein
MKYPLKLVNSPPVFALSRRIKKLVKPVRIGMKGKTASL